MSTSKKRGRPSRTPEEELVEWHTSLHWLLKIVGVDWFANKLSLFNSKKGCAQLREISSGHRHEATSSLVLLKKTKPDSPAHKCAIKWIEARARQLGAEADAIDLLVGAFELELPNRVASCLMGVLLDVAVTVKKKAR